MIWLPQIPFVWDSLISLGFSPLKVTCPLLLHSKFMSSGGADPTREARGWVRDPMSHCSPELQLPHLPHALLLYSLSCLWVRSSQEPKPPPYTPWESPTGWLGRNLAKHPSATHVFVHTAATAFSLHRSLPSHWPLDANLPDHPQGTPWSLQHASLALFHSCSSCTLFTPQSHEERKTWF